MINISKGDITEFPFHIDCIVNSAHPSLGPGGGVCGAIFKAAGPELIEYCAQLGPQVPVTAVLTPGFRLIRHIIHTVIPRYDGQHDRLNDLKEGYRKTMDLAIASGIRSIAFPSLGTGIYGYPLAESAQIAVEVLNAYDKAYGIDIYVVCYDEKTFQAYLIAQNNSRLH